MIRTLLILFSVLHICGCRSNQVTQQADLLCFSFDVRQCQTDIFVDTVSESADKSDRETKMLNWLSSLQIDVSAVSLSLDYHEGVCDACDMCPTGDRYFVTYQGVLPKMDGLRLLNFEMIECL